MFKTISTLSQETRNPIDDDDDGTIDRITHYAYDDDGNRTRAEIGFDADGNINLTRFDDDADGNFDRIEAYTYNSDGTRIRIRFDEWLCENSLGNASISVDLI